MNRGEERLSFLIYRKAMVKAESSKKKKTHVVSTSKIEHVYTLGEDWQDEQAPCTALDTPTPLCSVLSVDFAFNCIILLD